MPAGVDIGADHEIVLVLQHVDGATEVARLEPRFELERVIVRVRVQVEWQQLGLVAMRTRNQKPECDSESYMRSREPLTV